MTATTAIEPGAQAPATASTIAGQTGTDSADNERLSPRRKTVVATTLVALIAALAALVGIVFPGMLAAAVAIAVVAVLVTLDQLLSPRDLQQPPRGYWTF
jgi:hypothetical protein